MSFSSGQDVPADDGREGGRHEQGRAEPGSSRSVTRWVRPSRTLAPTSASSGRARTCHCASSPRWPVSATPISARSSGGCASRPRRSCSRSPRGCGSRPKALYVRAGILERREASAVSDAVLADLELTERQKQVLLEIYQSFRGENERSQPADWAAVVQQDDPKSSPSTSSSNPSATPTGPVADPSQKPGEVIIMAVSLPTSADRPQGPFAGHQGRSTPSSTTYRTPLLAWIGAGDLAVNKVNDAVAKARTRAAERRGAGPGPRGEAAGPGPGPGREAAEAGHRPAGPSCARS